MCACVAAEIKEKSEALNLFEFMCLRCIQLEASAGKNKSRRNFHKRLQGLLKKEARPIERVPAIGGRELDLPVLYRCARITALTLRAEAMRGLTARW